MSSEEVRAGGEREKEGGGEEGREKLIKNRICVTWRVGVRASGATRVPAQVGVPVPRRGKVWREGAESVGR